MEAWKPMIITLLCVPPIILTVTVVYFWWRRHISLSLASSYRLYRFGFWFLVAFGPLAVWLPLRHERPDYWFCAVIVIQWIIGIWRAIPKLREYQKRLGTKS